MTVKEFVDVVSKNPAFLDNQMVVVTAAQQLVGGEFDGAVKISSKPVQSVVIGFRGLLMFVDTKAPVNEETAIRHSSMLAIYGPSPACLDIGDGLK